MSRAEFDQVKQLTTLLRSSEEPFWSRVRDLLRERGIDSARAVLAECFPDDNSFEFGVLVTRQGAVFQFGVDYLGRSISEGIFSEWEDLTSSFGSTPYRASIEAALSLLKEETAG